jgi:type II secretory pathway predicted ATPase ExeA
VSSRIKGKLSPFGNESQRIIVIRNDFSILRQRLENEVAVTYLGKRFRDALNEVLTIPTEEAVQLVVEKPLQGPLPEKVNKELQLAQTLYDAFEHTHNEVDNLLVALNCKYVPRPRAQP